VRCAELLGGLSGVLLASPPIDWHVTDTYFVVAHFHYVLFGAIVFAVFGGVYFWFPKMTGRMMNERLGKLTFIGFHTTFLVQHRLGNDGMPSRYADYLPADGFTTLNTISTIGVFILGASTLPFVWNVWTSYRCGPQVGVEDPWGHGMSLEWATSCPPPAAQLRPDTPRPLRTTRLRPPPPRTRPRPLTAKPTRGEAAQPLRQGVLTCGGHRRRRGLSRRARRVDPIGVAPRRAVRQ
jgi:heme/copper-type cytochrome/quinol oxidase subunit 1